MIKTLLQFPAMLIPLMFGVLAARFCKCVVFTTQFSTLFSTLFSHSGNKKLCQRQIGEDVSLICMCIFY